MTNAVRLLFKALQKQTITSLYLALNSTHLPTLAKPAIPKHTASFLVFTKGVHWPFLCMSNSCSFSSNALFAMKNSWFTPALTKTRLSSDLAQSFTSAFLVAFVMASIILE